MAGWSTPGGIDSVHQSATFSKYSMSSTPALRTACGMWWVAHPEEREVNLLRIATALAGSFLLLLNLAVLVSPGAATLRPLALQLNCSVYWSIVAAAVYRILQERRESNGADDHPHSPTWGALTSAPLLLAPESGLPLRARRDRVPIDERSPGAAVDLVDEDTPRATGPGLPDRPLVHESYGLHAGLQGS